MLLKRQRSSNPPRISRPSNVPSLNGELLKQDSQMFGELPFELTKEQLDKFCVGEQEESTLDSMRTHPRSGVSSKFTLTPTSGDFQISGSDDKLDKLMKDLAFIDQPLTTKRLRTKKNKDSSKSLELE